MKIYLALVGTVPIFSCRHATQHMDKPKVTDIRNVNFHLTEQIITINQLYVHQRNTVSDKSNINKNCNLKKKKKYHLYKNKSQQFTIM